MGISEDLKLSQEWMDLGIVSPSMLEQFQIKWTTSEDRSPEHYRWRAFVEFVDARSSIDEKTAISLYDLGAKDPDKAMRGSMMALILKRKDCPEELLERAARSNERFLHKIAGEKGYHSEKQKL